MASRTREQLRAMFGRLNSGVRGSRKVRVEYVPDVVRPGEFDVVYTASSGAVKSNHLSRQQAESLFKKPVSLRVRGLKLEAGKRLDEKKKTLDLVERAYAAGKKSVSARIVNGVDVKDFNEINPAVEIGKSWDVDGYYVPNTKGRLLPSIQAQIKRIDSQNRYFHDEAKVKAITHLREAYKKLKAKNHAPGTEGLPEQLDPNVSPRARINVSDDPAWSTSLTLRDVMTDKQLKAIGRLKNRNTDKSPAEFHAALLAIVKSDDSKYKGKFIPEYLAYTVGYVIGSTGHIEGRSNPIYDLPPQLDSSVSPLQDFHPENYSEYELKSIVRGVGLRGCEAFDYSTKGRVILEDDVFVAERELRRRGVR